MNTNNTVGANLRVCPAIEANPRVYPTKQEILSKTHCGLLIYSHILRLYYPDEVVLRLVERDCGLCRNPFNINRETLHIWIGKTDTEIACHTDTQNAIPAGDVFDFAELHYKQQGDELLQTLNKELHLRIGEQRNFYAQSPYSPYNPKSPKTPYIPLFSFYKAPISNTKPHKAVSLLQIYNAIKGNYYQERTEKLRTISDVRQARQFKAANFDYCTFSGVFTTRNDKALLKPSGLLCLDFDHLQNIKLLRNQLLQDEYFDTQLLFVSPSGDGLKWIIQINPPLESPPFGDLGSCGYSHGDYFVAIANYISQTYSVTVDKSGRDISRACYLPHDSEVFINPIYLKHK